MQFAKTWEKVLSGEKTQTRRLVKLGDKLIELDGLMVVTRKTWSYVSEWEPPYRDQIDRAFFVCGNDYAVQPGRGKAAVGRIRITGIRREDVRNISETDAIAEGFVDRISFLETWVNMHDRSRGFYKDGYLYHQWRGRARGWEVGDQQSIIDALRDRMLIRYDAWVLNFEVLK